MPHRHGATKESVAITQGRVRQHLVKGNFEVVFKTIQDIAEGSTRDYMSALFHSLVQLCSKVKQHVAAAWCVFAMKEFGLRPDRFMFNVAMDTCAKAGDLKLATKLWEEIAAHGIQPSAISYNTMINACAQARDGPQAEIWIQRMSFAGFPLCILSFSSVIAAFAKVGKYAKAEEWYERAGAAGIDADVILYNSLINACAEGGRPDRAEMWFTKMLAAGVVADDTTYNSLIKASAKTGDIVTSEHWINEMVRSNKTLTVITFGSVLHACAMARNLDRAEYWMERMIRIRLTPSVLCFNSVLHACAHHGEYVGALKWFGMMSSVGVRPSRISYNFIIHAYLTAGEFASAEAWLNRMVTAGFRADTPCYILLARALRQMDGVKAFNPLWRYKHSVEDPSSLQAHYLIIKAYARAMKLDLIRTHVKQEIANIGKSQSLGNIFHDELEEICLASGGLRFASAVFHLLHVPIGECATSTCAKAPLRPLAGCLPTNATVLDESVLPCPVPSESAYCVRVNVPVEADTFTSPTTRSYMRLGGLLAFDQESIGAFCPTSESDETVTMMRVSESIPPSHLGKDNSRVDLSDDDFYTSTMCFSL